MRPGWRLDALASPGPLPPPTLPETDLLRADVQRVGLPHGIERSLLAKLDAMANAVDTGDQAQACDSLSSYVNHVQALTGKKIAVAPAAGLVADARWPVAAGVRRGLARVERSWAATRPIPAAARVSLGMDAHNLADLYDLPTLDWESVRHVMDSGVTQAPDSGGPNRHSSWLTTVDPDGTPHTTGGGRALGRRHVLVPDRPGHPEGAQPGDRTRGARSPWRRTSSTSSSRARAEPVTDPETVAAMAARWAEGGWPAHPDETGRAITAEYSAPSAGPPPWTVYRVTPVTATAVATVEPGGATRWTF